MTVVSASGTTGRASASPLLVSCPIQEVDAAEIQVQVCLYAFDLIYLNGKVSSRRRSCARAEGPRGGV